MSECLHGEHWMWELRHAGVNRIKVLLLPSTCTPLGLVQTLSSSSFQWLHVALRVFCSAAQPNREGMKQREGSWSCRAGEGHLHSGTSPAPGSHLSPACKLDHVFTASLHMECAQADTPIVPESEGGPFLHLCGFGILCKCSISSSLQQPSREWAGKGDNSLGCSLLLLGAVKFWHSCISCRVRSSSVDSFL